MAHENTVSFKVYLQKPENGNPEVRRFGINKDVVTNFSYLKMKLQTVFPTLQGQNITVSWKDGDNDEIVISSDDELMIALTEMQTDVYKLYVVMNNARSKGASSSGSTASTGNNRHVGITCDACEGEVRGFRYKCIQCEDFDLCSNCEAKHHHDQHFMIRLPFPVPLHAHFGRNLAHRLCKSARKAGRQTTGDSNEQETSQCPFVFHGKSHLAGKHRHRGLLDYVTAYLDAFIHFPPENESQPEDHKTNHPNPTEDTKECNATADPQVDYLMSVGKTVAEVLDPLGIDVEVQVSNKEGKITTKPKDTNLTEKNPDKVKLAGDVDIAPTEKESPPATNNDKSNTQSPTQSECGCPVADEWTLLNERETEPLNDQDNLQSENSAVPNAPSSAQNEGQNATSDVQNGAATNTAHSTILTAAHNAAHNAALAAAAAAAATAASTDANAAMSDKTGGAISKQTFPPFFSHVIPPPIYHAGQAQGMGWNQGWNPYNPSQMIPPMPVPPMQSQRLLQPTHRNPKIADALQKMIAMGFTNEGGWLTQLLETKNGDIDGALDVLQLVKK